MESENLSRSLEKLHRPFRQSDRAVKTASASFLETRLNIRSIMVPTVDVLYCTYASMPASPDRRYQIDACSALLSWPEM